MQLERITNVRPRSPDVQTWLATSPQASVLHHRVTNPTDHPPNFRYPAIPYLPQGLMPVPLDVGKFIENTLPTTHRFLAKHTGMSIHHVIHVFYPCLPFF